MTSTVPRGRQPAPARAPRGAGQPPAEHPRRPDRDLVLGAAGRQHGRQPGRGPPVQRLGQVDQAAPAGRALQPDDPAQTPDLRLHRAGHRVGPAGADRAPGQAPQPALDPGVGERLHQRHRGGQPGRHHRMIRMRILDQAQQRHHPGHRPPAGRLGQPVELGRGRRLRSVFGRNPVNG